MSGLYSPINKLMEQVTRPKGTGAEYMAELSKKPGYKPAEAEDRDLQTLMALPQMQRAEFMEKLKGQANKFPLKMRELGEGQTHHEAYTLPGGENYREILLHTPMPEGQGYRGVSHHFGGTPNILASIRVKDRVTPGPKMYAVQSKQPGFLEGGKQYKTIEEAKAAMESFPESIRPSLFLTSFNGPNKRTLHLEEIQSDWHQEGREKGYGKKDPLEKTESGDWVYTRPDGQRISLGHNIDEEMFRRAAGSKTGVVPYGPHAKDWHELALKAMIQHAAENGYDQIAVTPGAEQAKRYGLEKQISKLHYNADIKRLRAFNHSGREVISKDMTPDNLPQFVGKDVAKTLLSTTPEFGVHTLEGQDLNVGGEGMKGFYDKMVPTFLNKFGKKHGVQVQPGTIGTDEYTVARDSNPQTPYRVTHVNSPDIVSRHPNMHAAWDEAEKLGQAPVHTFDITPEMRDDVVKNGIPRYAEGGEVEVRPTVKDEAIQRKVPEMEAAAKALQTGTITRKDYDKVVQQHKPVKPYTFVPKPASDADAARALMENKKPQWRGHEQWPAGRKVGLRLDIPAYEHHGVWVNSVHDEEGSGKDKYPTAYHSVSSVKNATFDASPDKAVRVATGEQNKSPFARIKGELHHITEDEAVEHMKQHLNHPEWAQVGMDPRRHGYFYDRKTLKPVTHSEHVVQIGPLVLAKNPKYGKRESYAKGGSIKPVGHAVVKEKVTISPNMDAMQYELMGVKHFTKKVK